MARRDARLYLRLGLPPEWGRALLASERKRRLLGSFWHGRWPKNAMAQAIFGGRLRSGSGSDLVWATAGFSMLMGDFLSLAQARSAVNGVVSTTAPSLYRARAEIDPGFLGRDRVQAIRIRSELAEAVGIKASGWKLRAKSRREYYLRPHA